MSIDQARKFIERAVRDEAFVVALNDALTYDELQGILTEQGFSFSYGHFDEAFHNLLTKCQTEGYADQLHQVKMWWDFLDGHFAQEMGAKAS